MLSQMKDTVIYFHVPPACISSAMSGCTTTSDSRRCAMQIQGCRQQLPAVVASRAATPSKCREPSCDTLSDTQYHHIHCILLPTLLHLLRVLLQRNPRSTTVATIAANTIAVITPVLPRCRLLVSPLATILVTIAIAMMTLTQ